MGFEDSHPSGRAEPGAAGRSGRSATQGPGPGSGAAPGRACPAGREDQGDGDEGVCTPHPGLLRRSSSEGCMPLGMNEPALGQAGPAGWLCSRRQSQPWPLETSTVHWQVRASESGFPRPLLGRRAGNRNCPGRVDTAGGRAPGLLALAGLPRPRTLEHKMGTGLEPGFTGGRGAEAPGTNPPGGTSRAGPAAQRPAAHSHRKSCPTAS